MYRKSNHLYGVLWRTGDHKRAKDYQKYFLVLIQKESKAPFQFIPATAYAIMAPLDARTVAK